MDNTTIAIIGAGNMGSSLLSGLIANQVPASQLIMADLDTAKLQRLKQQFNISITENNADAVKTADVVILAVKPQIMAEITQQLAHVVQNKKPLVISVAAGIHLDHLQKWLGNNISIVRCMPNMPALIRCGATALYANAFVSTKQRDLAESILRAVGLITWLTDEKQMDAVTALSGSGPAYFFFVIEALQAAGEKLGLPHETAQLLTLQTALGAARLALESRESAKELRHRVTSPGGTTEAAIHVLEQQHLDDIFAEALAAAKIRSEELGNQGK